MTEGDTLSIYIPPGGAGATHQGQSGGAGDDATCTVNGTTYTSANGSLLPSGYYNPLSGNLFAEPGIDGVAGADGGSTHVSPDGDYVFAGNIGDSIGGTNGDDVFYERSASTYITAYGGGGGGASNTNYGWTGYDAEQLGTAVVNAGDGSYGADGERSPIWANNGQGGHGGDGGGGGGGGGGLQKSAVTPWQNCKVGEGGIGGSFGYGSDGGDGWAVILY